MKSTYKCQPVSTQFRALQGSGFIVNVSSIGGQMTFPLGSLYHGTKFAVEGITESLAFELSVLGCKAKIIEPGTIATDFGGRSFDFQNDESAAEYQPMIGAMLKVMEAVRVDKSRAAPPSVVAEVIYQAATDGTDRLRYTAGYDAQMFLEPRVQSTDEEYIASLKKAFGI